MSDYQKEKLKKSQLELSDFVVHSKDMNGVSHSMFDFNRLQQLVDDNDEKDQNQNNLNSSNICN